MIVGVDEAGRGPLAGVVSACALHLISRPPFEIKDSKELSVQAREEIFPWLMRNAVFSVSVATPEEIDRLNILEATFLCFDRAIAGILAKSPRLKDAEFIIDGPLFRTSRDIKYRCVIGADKLVKEVSCAAIMAKVARDHLMKTADFLYPEWDFASHKGYPTRAHRDIVAQKGLTPLHRRSFSPCGLAEEKIKDR